MKKQKILICIGVIIALVIIIGIIIFKKENSTTTDTISLEDITDITWTRTTEYDTEFFTLHSDNSFSYYCACGNPVDNYDLCESYKYDSSTQTIKLNCDAKNIVDEIKIISYEEDKLVLDFDEEEREFSPEE